MDRSDPLQDYRGPTPYPRDANRTTRSEWLLREGVARARVGDSIDVSNALEVEYLRIRCEELNEEAREQQARIETLTEKARANRVRTDEELLQLADRIALAMDARLKAEVAAMEMRLSGRIDQANRTADDLRQKNNALWAELRALQHGRDAERLAAELSTAHQPMMILPG